MGAASLGSETQGDRNVAVGYALETQNNTSDTDVYNVVGYFAGGSITTASSNTLVGGLAGDALTTGGSNTGVGRNALGSATTGE